MSSAEQRDFVGPVLHAGPLGAGVVAAIERTNAGTLVVNRGAYIRVLVPKRCRVSRAAIELETRRTFVLPSDLEAIMSSFKGKFSVSEDEAVWEL